MVLSEGGEEPRSRAELLWVKWLVDHVRRRRRRLCGVLGFGGGHFEDFRTLVLLL
jgi:hypothetical protein